MKNQIIEKIFRVVIYLRLSDEDGDNQESDSISNQRILNRGFLEGKQEFQIVKECVDDGYTGTNFNRPGFQEMMRLIENGEADCIVVKDLSRFGRDFSGVLQYVERILPKMGVRLILVNDQYDSIAPNHDFITLRLKSFINDIYPADTSRSVRSNLHAKMVHGQCVAPFASYGFLKSPEDKHQLMIDPVAGSVVKDIFHLKLKGHSLNDIAENLNLRGILTPLAYKRICLKQNLKTALAEDTLKQIKQVSKTQNLSKLKSRKKGCEEKVQKVKQQKMEFYEAFVDGKVTKEGYLRKKELLTQKEHRYKELITELQEQIIQAEEKRKLAKSPELLAFSKCKDLTELSYEVIQELVEVIYFYDPEHIEVIWKYRDEFLEAEKALAE